jgi:uncharacterized SAM-binding protein YcdF (DUF218 family)
MALPRLAPIRLRRPQKTLVGLCAGAFLLQLVAALPVITSRTANWLRFEEAALAGRPDTIVVLGGAGIPSATGLMRTYHAAQLAHKWPDARVIVAHPSSPGAAVDNAARMADELELRGIEPVRIVRLREGRNTHAQAGAVRALLGDAGRDQRLALVTTGSHMRRAVLCFRREGFTHVAGIWTYTASGDEDLGGGRFWRYGFWANWRAQIEHLREGVALAVYQARGWI